MTVKKVWSASFPSSSLLVCCNCRASLACSSTCGEVVFALSSLVGAYGSNDPSLFLSPQSVSAAVLPALPAQSSGRDCVLSFPPETRRGSSPQPPLSFPPDRKLFSRVKAGEHGGSLSNFFPVSRMFMGGRFFFFLFPSFFSPFQNDRPFLFLQCPPE